MRFFVPLSMVLLASLVQSAEPAAIRHEPVQPKPEVPVLVTAKLAEGTTKATLKLQAVAPGKYIRKSDAEYEKEWIELPMRDDGKEGDAKAGDGIFSAQVPAKYQKHRWLLRYRIVSVNKAGNAQSTPPCGTSSEETNCKSALTSNPNDASTRSSQRVVP